MTKETTTAPDEESTQPTAKTKATDQVMLVGLDLGTNTSFILGGSQESNDFETSKLLPSVVGYVGDGLIQGILPSDDRSFFGEEAIENKIHLNLVWPLKDGVIGDVDAAKDLVKHLRSLVDPVGNSEIRAVIGIPANATKEARETLRSVVTGIFERVLLIPEPFLAALGNREDSRLGEKDYVDPVQNSLFVDIGAGTTDLCLVQGYFPRPNDQISFPVAGDKIDELIQNELEQVYPDIRLTHLQIREIKEKHSYVGRSRRPIDEKVIVSGKSQTIEVADAVGNSCNHLLNKIFDSTRELIGRASPDSVGALLQNILITGGGSRIKGIDTELQNMLIEDGFESPKVRTVGADYKRFVGVGAMKAAHAARDNQWQILFK